MTTRRDFLKQGSVIAAGVAITGGSSEAQSEPTTSRDLDNTAAVTADQPGTPTTNYTCPRCGSTRSKPQAIKIITDGSDSKRLYGSRALSARWVEGCGDCKDIGPRTL